jgi:hypothetical protein
MVAEKGSTKHFRRRSTVPVHPLLEDIWDHQLGFSRCATGLLDRASPIATD